MRVRGWRPNWRSWVRPLLLLWIVVWGALFRRLVGYHSLEPWWYWPAWALSNGPALLVVALVEERSAMKAGKHGPAADRLEHRRDEKAVK